MDLVGCWNSLALARQMRAREPNIPPQDLTLDAIPATTLPVCRAWDWPTVCWWNATEIIVDY